MLVAISTQPSSQQVERFGHDFPVLLVNVEERQIRGMHQLPPQSGCCRTLAQRIKEADVLICTGVGQGAARHLAEAGVEVAVVKPGLSVSEALDSLLRDALRPGDYAPSECTEHADGGDNCGHDESHEALGHHCGCGNHKSS